MWRWLSRGRADMATILNGSSSTANAVRHKMTVLSGWHNHLTAVHLIPVATALTIPGIPVDRECAT